MICLRCKRQNTHERDGLCDCCRKKIAEALKKQSKDDEYFSSVFLKETKTRKEWIEERALKKLSQKSRLIQNYKLTH